MGLGEFLPFSVGFSPAQLPSFCLFCWPIQCSSQVALAAAACLGLIWRLATVAPLGELPALEGGLWHFTTLRFLLFLTPPSLAPAISRDFLSCSEQNVCNWIWIYGRYFKKELSKPLSLYLGRLLWM